MSFLVTVTIQSLSLLDYQVNLGYQNLNVLILRQSQVQNNCYRIKSKTELDTRIPIARPRELQPRQVQSIGYLVNTVEEAAVSAAYEIAEAENKSFVAAEAVKEAERVTMMAEDMESLLQFATDCHDQSIMSTQLYFLLISFSGVLKCNISLLVCGSMIIMHFSLHAGRYARRNCSDGIGSIYSREISITYFRNV